MLNLWLVYLIDSILNSKRKLELAAESEVDGELDVSRRKSDSGHTPIIHHVIFGCKPKRKPERESSYIHTYLTLIGDGIQRITRNYN
jgi:hypothetical protein